MTRIKVASLAAAATACLLLWGATPALAQRGGHGFGGFHGGFGGYHGGFGGYRGYSGFGGYRGYSGFGGYNHGGWGYGHAFYPRYGYGYGGVGLWGYSSLLGARAYASPYYYNGYAYGGYPYAYGGNAGYYSDSYYPDAAYGYPSVTASAYPTTIDTASPQVVDTRRSMYYSPPADNKARIVVTLPAGAKLWVAGEETTPTGERREFESPPLVPGKTYTYEMKATWEEDGRPVERASTVKVRANETSTVSFGDAGAVPEVKR